MTPFWVGCVTFLAFACAAFLAMSFAAWATSRWPRFRDLPVRKEPTLAMTAALVIGTGAIGATYVSRGASGYALGLIVIICLTLDFAAYCDVRVGRSPLAVTLPALGLLVASALAARDWVALISAAVVAAPFAFAALWSKKGGLGWSEVQLVMLGALVLNVTLGLLAFAVACFVAVGVALVRGTLKQPVTFAPYLALAIECALLTPSAIR